MKEFVEFIVKHLVDKPDEVKVDEVDGEPYKRWAQASKIIRLMVEP